MDPDYPESELLDQLELELRAPGRRAAGFLRSAWALIDSGLSTHPRSSEMVAYCVREVLASITDAHAASEPDERWSTRTTVFDTRKRYLHAREAADVTPGDPDAATLRAAADDLAAAVADLEALPGNKDLREKRLIAAIVDRTGRVPYGVGAEIVNEFHAVIGAANSGLHTELDPASAVDLYSRALSVLRRVYLPPTVRQQRLGDLAAVDHPGAEHLDRLRQVLLSPQHLVVFIRQLPTAAWLASMTDAGLLDPPTEGGTWPGDAVIDTLAPLDPDAVLGWLRAVYDRCRGGAHQAWYVFRAGTELGEGAHVLLSRVFVNDG